MHLYRHKPERRRLGKRGKRVKGEAGEAAPSWGAERVRAKYSWSGLRLRFSGLADQRSGLVGANPAVPRGPGCQVSARVVEGRTSPRARDRHSGESWPIKSRLCGVAGALSSGLSRRSGLLVNSCVDWSPAARPPPGQSC